MALDIASILDAVVSHALASGCFEQVNGHEPKDAPPAGLTAAVWPQTLGPARGSSGLASTSVRIGLTVRLYSGLTQEPGDAIDPAMVAALDTLMAAYSGDYDLGGLVREVDLLGAFGDPLGGQAGYLVQAGEAYRVWDITLPLICNDLWDQEASA
jgi:hypothetical protein